MIRNVEPNATTSSTPLHESNTNAAIAINLSPCSGDLVGEATNIELQQSDDRPLVTL